MADKLGTLKEQRGSVLRSSVGISGVRRTNDQYELNFNQLRKDYVGDSNIKLPFVKSSFIHYTACPLNL